MNVRSEKEWGQCRGTERKGVDSSASNGSRNRAIRGHPDSSPGFRWSARRDDAREREPYSSSRRKRRVERAAAPSQVVAKPPHRCAILRHAALTFARKLESCCGGALCGWWPSATLRVESFPDFLQVPRSSFSSLVPPSQKNGSLKFRRNVTHSKIAEICRSANQITFGRGTITPLGVVCTHAAEGLPTRAFLRQDEDAPLCSGLHASAVHGSTVGRSNPGMVRAAPT